tara:strand:- start:1725 stop:2015 length:291 start_codon:yes stop_codon:yes gene_type:complete
MSQIEQHEQKIVDELMSERSEIMSCGHINVELVGRIEEIDRQVSEIVSGDTFRSYELGVGRGVDDLDLSEGDLDIGFNENSHGFMSQSFHDPDIDY